MNLEIEDSEFVTLNSVKVVDNPEPAGQEFYKKTLTQLRDEFDKSIKIDETSGDIIIDLKPFFKTRYSEEFKREMTILKRMALNEKLHELFEHPLPRLFMDLKWAKAEKLFYLNLLILSVLIVSMIGYMIFYYSIVSEEIRDNSTGLAIWGMICKIGIIYLITRELCQFYLNFQHHLSLLNLMETFLIYFGLEAFFLPENVDISSRRNRHVILIFLCTYELLHILSKIPLANLSTYIEILKRVFKTFMKVLILYSIVIVSFGTCFHILYVRHDEIDQDKDFHNFQTFPIALLRTIFMMVGEFEADDMNVNSLSTGLCFFLFIITCTIILLNLLNALAISDTQEIIDDGKRFERIQRVQILYFYEKCIRNLINRETKFFPKFLKNLERKLGLAIYSQIFNIWPQLKNSGTIIIRTANNNKLIVVEPNDVETEIPNPNFMFKKFIPPFSKTLRKFRDVIFECETASEYVVDAINEIIKEDLEDLKDLEMKRLIDEIKVLKDQFYGMEVELKIFFRNLQENYLNDANTINIDDKINIVDK